MSFMPLPQAGLMTLGWVGVDMANGTEDGNVSVKRLGRQHVNECRALRLLFCR